MILLNGRLAGKKVRKWFNFVIHEAVIVKTFEEGTAERPYPHCIVAGVQKTPLGITKVTNKFAKLTEGYGTEAHRQEIPRQAVHQGRQLQPHHADPLQPRR